MNSSQRMLSHSLLPKCLSHEPPVLQDLSFDFGIHCTSSAGSNGIALCEGLNASGRRRISRAAPTCRPCSWAVRVHLTPRRCHHAVSARVNMSCTLFNGCIEGRKLHSLHEWRILYSIPSRVVPRVLFRERKYLICRELNLMLAKPPLELSRAHSSCSIAVHHTKALEERAP